MNTKQQKLHDSIMKDMGKIVYQRLMEAQKSETKFMTPDIDFDDYKVYFKVKSGIYYIPTMNMDYAFSTLFAIFYLGSQADVKVQISEDVNKEFMPYCEKIKGSKFKNVLKTKIAESNKTKIFAGLCDGTTFKQPDGASMDAFIKSLMTIVKEAASEGKK